MFLGADRSRPVSSVVFVPADASNVVPDRGLVALITLVHLCVGLSRYTRRNHVEVHHGVARWSLMALHAVLRVWRRMAILRNRPFRDAMARSTIAAEEAPVAILHGMAGRAVQSGLKRRNIRVVFEQRIVIHVPAYPAGLRVRGVCRFQL